MFHLPLLHHMPAPSLKERPGGDGGMDDADGRKGVTEGEGHPPPLPIPVDAEAIRVAVQPEIDKADDHTSPHRHPGVVGTEGDVPGSRPHPTTRPGVGPLGVAVPGVDGVNRLIRQLRQSRAAGAAVGTNMYALLSFP